MIPSKLPFYGHPNLLLHSLCLLESHPPLYCKAMSFHCSTYWFLNPVDFSCQFMSSPSSEHSQFQGTAVPSLPSPSQCPTAQRCATPSSRWRKWHICPEKLELVGTETILWPSHAKSTCQMCHTGSYNIIITYHVIVLYWYIAYNYIV